MFKHLKIKAKITLSFFMTALIVTGVTTYLFYDFTLTNLKKISDLYDIEFIFSYKELLLVSVGGGFITILIFLVVAYLIGRMISNPIKNLSNTARAVAGGDFSRRAEVASKDEIGQLATTFNVMTDTLSRMGEEAKTIIQVLPEPLFILDKKGRVTLANKSACSALGCKSDEDIIGKSIKDFMEMEVDASKEEDERNLENKNTD